MKKQVNDSNLKTGLKVILAVVLAVFGVYMGILFITAFWPVVLVAGLVCVVVGWPAGQVQGQAQGQQQSIGDVNVNIDNSNGGSSDTRGAASENINMRGVRGFASAAEINHVGIPSYFGPATKNANVQPADTMLMFKDTFTRAEVESYLKGTSVDRSTNGEEESIFTWGKKGDPKQIIKVILTPPAKGTVIQTALITTKAKNGDTESKDVLYTALLRGLDTNSDLLLITAQGAGTIMKSFGWGIGASYTRATLSTDEATGGVSAGGLGISGGSAGYKSLPWIQSIVLCNYPK